MNIRHIWPNCWVFHFQFLWKLSSIKWMLRLEAPFLQTSDNSRLNDTNQSEHYLIIVSREGEASISSNWQGGIKRSCISGNIYYSLGRYIATTIISTTIDYTTNYRPNPAIPTISSGNVNILSLLAVPVELLPNWKTEAKQEENDKLFEGGFLKWKSHAN